ncbi:hypothetical protein D3C87_1916550 [compost metagenome]
MRMIVGVNVLDPVFKGTIHLGVFGQATKPPPGGRVKQVSGFEVVIPDTLKRAVEGIFPAGLVVA